MIIQVLQLYTERQKKHHFFRVSLTEIQSINMNHFCISAFSHEKILCFSDILIRSIKAYLCQNIMHFDSVDFSERRPEEVISFF